MPTWWPSRKRIAVGGTKPSLRSADRPRATPTFGACSATRTFRPSSSPRRTTGTPCRQRRLGPAPLHRYNPNRALYHFRWFWDYSGGQMTNLAAHALDIVHWFLDVQGPTAVTSMGGRFSLEDNGETPDTQDAVFEYPGFTAL